MKRLLLAALLGSTVLSATAYSADLPSRTNVPAAPIIDPWNPWMIRVRALAVVPDESSSLKLNGNPIDGDKVNISNSVIPELDITYFFTKNIAVELILGTTPHNVKAGGAIAGLGPIGRTWLLPPTLTLQYHFNITDQIKPYVGAGINYTFFYNNSSRGIFENFHLDNNVGFALQAGIDIMIDRHWGVNFDVKKIWLETDAKANIPGVGRVTGKVKIDPWLIGGGIVYRF